MANFGASQLNFGVGQTTQQPTYQRRVEATLKYDFPDHETLARYLAMLRDVLVDLRFRATGQDPGAVELLDAVHNVPDLLTRWPDMKEEWVIGHLEAYEQKYLGGHGRYSGVLKQGPREGWQLRWQSGKSS